MAEGPRRVGCDDIVLFLQSKDVLRRLKSAVGIPGLEQSLDPEQELVHISP